MAKCQADASIAISLYIQCLAYPQGAKIVYRDLNIARSDDRLALRICIEHRCNVAPETPFTHRRFFAIFCQCHEARRRTNPHCCDTFRRVGPMYESLLPLKNVVDNDIMACDINNGGLIRKRNCIGATTLYSEDEPMRQA